MKELIKNIRNLTYINYTENEIESINRSNSLQQSFRVYKDGMVGIHYQCGSIEEQEGYRRAEANLVRKREYPFELESGVRTMDLRERLLTDQELKRTAADIMNFLTINYPDFTFGMSVYKEEVKDTRTNDAGMDYRYYDGNTGVGVSFKHKDSKDICDGSFSFNMRDFDFAVFEQMAKDYLDKFTTYVDFSEDLIIDTQYYGLVGIFQGLLNGENLQIGTSLLTGRMGDQVFSEDFTLYHDLTQEESWLSTFWDGDGCVLEGDCLTLVEKGVPKVASTDKRIAKKYSIPHTRTAYTNMADRPGPGYLNLRIKKSEKTIKELLNGRLAVIPVNCAGGGFNEKLDYVLPVSSALLFDGEKVLGRLAPFTLVSNAFDMFGKDFIRVGADKPIFNDKQILFRARREES